MKRKLLTVLLALVAALCLCLGLTACGGDDSENKENDGHEHIYTVENKCSVCGKEWEYTKSDALDYTKVVLDGVEGYDVRFGEYVYYDMTTDPQTGLPVIGDQIIIGKELQAEEVVFPYGHNGLPVISIGRFYPCMSDTVKHITVPKSILSFGQGMVNQNGTRGAFRCTALEKLDLPDGLPVLSRQYIPTDNQSASNTAFPLWFNTLFYGQGGFEPENCPLYDDPQYRENGALYIGNYLFDTDFEEPVDTYTVKDGTKVVISLRGAKHVILPDSVEVIGYSAFSNSELESIEVGNGIEEIGDGAFSWSDLTSITLPDKPIYIGAYAFRNTPFFEDSANWKYPDGENAGNYTSRSLYIGNHLIYVVGAQNSVPSFEIKPNLKSIAGDAFEYSTVGELHIPSIETWLKIRHGGGISANKLIVDGQETTEITIPSSITEISDYAFTGMEFLTKVTLHDGVTKIGDGAFANSGITSIAIPASVIKIGTNAFGYLGGLASFTVSDANPNYASENGILYNKAKTRIVTVPIRLTGAVVLPNSLTSIGYLAFNNCYGVTSIEIPAGVTSINETAFSGCTALASIMVNANNPNYSSQDGILYNKEKTEFVSIPLALTGAITIPDSITTIESGAFYGRTELTDITVPDSVTSIGERAFQNTAYYNDASNWDASGVLYIGNHLIEANTTISGAYSVRTGTKTFADYAFMFCYNLTEITIPNSVTSIGNNAFGSCSHLTSIEVDEGNQTYSSQDGILYNKEKTKFVHIPRALTGAVTIPNGVTTIGKEAFRDCTGLTGITIPDSVTTIENDAFEGCTGLTGITIPDSVTTIGNDAFEGCTGLTSIVIPANVTSVGSGAFGNCTELQSATIENGETMLGNRVFYGCSRLTNIVFPDNMTWAWDRAFIDCTGLTSIEIPDGVIGIGEEAFRGCTRLANITIPDSVTWVGMNAFYGTAYYDDPSHWDAGSVLYIDNHLIVAKSTISGAYTIKTGTKTIACGAFAGGTGLTGIEIPDSMAWIGYDAFAGCTGLTNNITITGATTIGSGAFYGCTGLTNITITGAITIESGAFRGCTGLESVTLGNDVTAIRGSAFAGCTGLTSIVIPDSVTEIGESVFENCIGLTSVVIPHSVTKIEWWAFHNCTSLTDIQFQGTVADWNAITKESGWDNNTGDYTVTCTNGKIAKDGTVTMN